MCAMGGMQYDGIVAKRRETRSWKLSDKTAKCEILFERSYIYYALQPLTARLAKLPSKLGRLDCSYWFHSDHSSSERLYEIVEVHFAEMTGDRY